MNENRIGTRCDVQKEKYSRFFIKNSDFKEKIKILNISKAGLLYEFPKDRNAMEVGDIATLMFQTGEEVSTFAVTIRWASDYFKNTKKKEFRKYGAQINKVTLTNPCLWDDYTKYLLMKKRFSLK
ncbi:MAG: hypothetical protein NTX36_15715 [Proteobacteria bacterium]|nr:hypothetical protein [Pseudomonadota bacterium]